MADSLIRQWTCAQQIKEQLQILLHASKPTYEDIEILVHELRIACEKTVLSDFVFAADVCVEKHLWHAHTLINNRYRKILGRYKNDNKLVVEKRRIEKHYVDFIKTSQFFYKGYIQRLAAHFPGIKGLLQVAGKLSLDGLPADTYNAVSPEVQKLIEQSCHVTLLQLGDLSRYRNMLRTKKRSWEPAESYYQLANEIDPLSGIAYNKMAVIALADENHLNAVYHLYRAIAAPKPDPLASGNLGIEFKKILALRFTNENDPLASLIWCFILLHANFNEGVDFPKNQELQNKVLSRLCICLQENLCGNLLEKFVLISIAAQYHSTQRLQNQSTEKSSDVIRVLKSHINFNNRMMCQLLSILLLELGPRADVKECIKGTREKIVENNKKISAAACQVIPALRHYTLWLASSKIHMHPSAGSCQEKKQSKQLWSSYASVLTLLVNYFPVKEMATVSYLLDEDETTIGFAPFRDLNLSKALDFYSRSDGQLKPRIGENGIKRSHPSIEMQSRILDIVCCGIQMQLDDEVPLKLLNESGSPVFHFIEKNGTTPEPTLRSKNDYFPSRSESSHYKYGSVEPAEDIYQDIPDDYEVDSDSQDSVEINMNRMVDNLLEPCSNGLKTNSFENFHGPCVGANIEAFSPVLSTTSDYRRQSTPKLLPSLPGLYSTVFTPQPNELQTISPKDSKLSYSFLMRSTEPMT